MEHRYTGLVVKHAIARGSKSERQALLLRTPQGEELILRRLGAHAFEDSSLDALVGKRIEGVGQLTGTTLLLRRWRVLDG